MTNHALWLTRRSCTGYKRGGNLTDACLNRDLADRSCVNELRLTRAVLRERFPELVVRVGAADDG